MSIQVGNAYRFDYPTEFTTLDDYTAHRGQQVTVIRPLKADEGDAMFRVRAANG